MEVLQRLKSQSAYNFDQLSQQHKVCICESTDGPVIHIKGYVKDHIGEVEKILNEGKANLEKCAITLSGSKMKLSHLTNAFTQHPDQARTFFATIFHLTSVEVICTDQTVKLTGPADKIKEAEKMINDSEFLKDYYNQSFDFESHQSFMTQTKKYLINKFKQQQLNVMIICTMNKTKKKSRKPSEGDLNQPKDTFTVWIESENFQHFGIACQIVKVHMYRFYTIYIAGYLNYTSLFCL